MNDVSAWNKFYETGKINDYLAYRDLKANVRVERNGEMLNDYGRERDSSVGGCLESFPLSSEHYCNRPL